MVASTRPPKPASPAVPAGPVSSRTSTLAILLTWDAGRARDLDQVIDDQVVGLDPRDAGLVRELASGSVAWLRLYDALADRFLRPGPQPSPLRWALRLMAHQLFALDRIPTHAAVGESVQALRENRCDHLAGVANAVGRKLATLRLAERDGDGPLGRLREADRPAAPGLRYSLPDALIEDLRPILPSGNPDIDLPALTRLAPLCTRSRPHAPAFIGHSIVRRDGPWTWWSDPAEALAGPVADGLAVVQDRSQGEVAELAKARPGERILDCCAAPGGKSRALADSGAWVIAADVAPAKATAMAKSFIGDSPSGILVMDGRRPALAPRSFDLVVVDAPCSNSGVLARRPEARWRYDRPRLRSLATLQQELLAAAAEMVRPDGRLLYATCSLSPEENQAITHQFAGWRILAERLTWPDAWQAGGYAAVLVRT